MLFADGIASRAVIMADDLVLDVHDLVPEDEDDSRECPNCGEPIKNVAIKCRHCHEQLGDPAWPGVFRSGRQVVMSRFGVFPPRCEKTNQPADHWLTRNLQCVPAWALAVLLLLGPLFFFAIAFSSGNSVPVCVPLSAARFQRRRRGRWIGAIVILGGIGAIVGGLLVDRNVSDSWMGPLIIAGLASLIVGTITIFMASRLVTVTRIEKHRIWLSGVHPAIVADFPEWRDRRP
jgi:hypothetical protein